MDDSNTSNNALVPREAESASRETSVAPEDPTSTALVPFRAVTTPERSLQVPLGRSTSISISLSNASRSNDTHHSVGIPNDAVLAIPETAAVRAHHEHEYLAPTGHHEHELVEFTIVYVFVSVVIVSFEGARAADAHTQEVQQWGYGDTIRVSAITALLCVLSMFVVTMVL
jgi:hypothetical protein